MVLHNIINFCKKVYVFYIYGRVGLRFDYLCNDCIISLINFKLGRIHQQILDKPYLKKQIQSIRICKKLCDRILSKKYYINNKNIIDYLDKKNYLIDRDIKLLYKIMAINYNYW